MYRAPSFSFFHVFSSSFMIFGLCCTRSVYVGVGDDTKSVMHFFFSFPQFTLRLFYSVVDLLDAIKCTHKSMLQTIWEPYYTLLKNGLRWLFEFCIFENYISHLPSFSFFNIEDASSFVVLGIQRISHSKTYKTSK